MGLVVVAGAAEVGLVAMVVEVAGPMAMEGATEAVVVMVAAVVMVEVDMVVDTMEDAVVVEEVSSCCYYVAFCMYWLMFTCVYAASRYCFWQRLFVHLSVCLSAQNFENY